MSQVRVPPASGMAIRTLALVRSERSASTGVSMPGTVFPR